MEITKTRSGTQLTLNVSGRLDTTTAPQLERTLNAELDGISTLILDVQNLEYLSSAGLRVLLSAQKQMNRQGSMTLKNVSAAVLEIFDITGFTDFLHIE